MIGARQRSQRLRRWHAVAAITVLATVLAGCAGRSHATPTGGHGASPTPGPTVLTKFTPYSAAGALSVPVAGRASGSCWTTSIMVAVPGAYRCLVGNDIADPCFAPPHPATPPTVACLADPWSGARLVTLSGPLPDASVVGQSANPWAVQLANGARCVASSGTVASVDGVSLNLLCPSGMAAGALDTTSRTWQVKYGLKSGGHLAPVAVTQAWHG